MSRPRLIAIDPPGCGCTECIIGDYVPLDLATDEQVLAMLQGYLYNNTGWDRDEFEVTYSIQIRRPAWE